MATPSQIDANRLNSQHSTGPRTEEGRAASAANSLKHGLYSKTALIPGEDPEEYEKHAAAYRARFQPATPDEEFQVETMIQAFWKRRRYSRIEAALIRKSMADAGPSGDPLAVVLSSANPDAPMLDRIIRAQEAATRAWERAFKRLQGLAGDRIEAEMLARAAAAKRAQSAPPPPPPSAPPPPKSTERTQSSLATFNRNVFGPIDPNLPKEERERLLALRL